MKKFILFTLSVLFFAATLASPAQASSARIELDQASPTVGDTATFTVTNPSGAKHVQLVCGPNVAYTTEGALVNETKPVGSSFTLTESGTCVAWLLKKGTPIVGTIFFVS